ncbi:MAG: phosphate/phosphite/phosphonate ABC transporter substrate-binding protein [Hydrogenovibrio crunogenus]|uniref:ABC transporter solute-binding component homolog n=1 Tax=Hydrogenovibrio crunogenus (strain DSM 25203 / XCL-2) TaxID=317025 RepID=Q31GA7_HYDCU|nr:phosphate/phosphite/phosphonate ABC transporter substrate-binding protein [Hydrogenovibrio crunogenus]
MKPFLKWILLATTALTGCDQGSSTDITLHYSETPPTTSITVYRFAIHPLHNPQKLIETFQPLINDLNQHLDKARIELEASRDYQVYEDKIDRLEPAFLLPNPWQTLVAMKKGYNVIAMAGNANDFKGIIIVRRDSNINTPQDLIGKTVAYPSPTALAAAIMPQYFLHQAGLNINKDIKNNYVGSQESSIMNVYLGSAAAGATWPPPWRAFKKDNPQEAAQLKVIWQTKPLLNNSVMVRDDVPPELAEQVRKYLLKLHHRDQGQKILAGMETEQFYAADNARYDLVRDYVQRFEQNVRLVRQP